MRRLGTCLPSLSSLFSLFSLRVNNWREFPRQQNSLRLVANEMTNRRPAQDFYRTRVLGKRGRTNEPLKVEEKDDAKKRCLMTS